ncbi:MAG TPA: aldehyde dehydrogenase family protein [Candidatus Saccharimonadales bacterium]|nr:aldehyde dehydrogenase family protein [Candidatus Saccharimonadales bacterium]
MANKRLEIRKTYKLYAGGNFVRSESGRVLSARTASGALLDNYSHASRKDLRNAVVSARAALDGWSKKSAYLRGQILYRAAEMLQCRAGELVHEVQRSLGSSTAKAQAEVTATIDRIVYFAGWTDKYSQVFSSVNPVATPHFNFTLPEPVGVVAVVAPDEPSLLGFVSMILPALVSGNTTVALTSDAFPLPALTFGEILATSDLPAGVVNILSGKRAELASHLASHMDINAILDGAGVPVINRTLQGGSGANLKRYARRDLSKADWLGPKAEEPWSILETVEFKTAWHPIGM